MGTDKLPLHGDTFNPGINNGMGAPLDTMAHAIHS